MAKKKIRLKGAAKQAQDISKQRLILLGMCVAIAFGGISYRMVSLGLSGVDAAPMGASQAAVTRGEERRAEIVDRHGMLLATDLTMASLYADPTIVPDKEYTALKLAEIFPELDMDAIYSDLQRQGRFVWIKRNLHPQEQDAVLDLGIPGLAFKNERKRAYPHGRSLAHVVGMAGVDNNGLMGIERSFNRALVSHDAEPLQLSIDLRVQTAVVEALREEVEEHQAIGAAGLVMDIHTGELLALASLPDFDPNVPASIQAEDMFNRATLGVYELGSSFKTFTFASAFEHDVIKMDHVYDATKPLKIGRFSIRDHHPKERWLTVPEVFMYSSNIGTARIADVMGAELQREYLGKLGLYDTVELELPELGTPMLPERWGRVQNMTVSYGHGIAVSPLHVARAYAILANGGTFVHPTLVKGQGRMEGQVIAPETTEVMNKMLRLVVAEGTGKQADVPGYMVGGKTGTAEKAGAGSYERKRMVTDFVGVFPMHKPRYVVMTMIDEPKGSKASWGYATAGWTAAPAAQDIISRIAPMLGIKPVDEDDPEIHNAFAIDYEYKPGKGKKIAAR